MRPAAHREPRGWDYLVVTASNDAQARAYEDQLRARIRCGALPQVRDAFVAADLDGRRIGSGGSTLLCLAEILRRERSGRGCDLTGAAAVEQVLSGLRILIVHAGGDSRRLPAYAPCGKIFVPLPGPPDAPVPPALFDRLVPAFLALPPGSPGRGQVVVAAGDALNLFDAAGVDFSRPGLIALACYATPEDASRHGVFCIGEEGSVSLYLQKPTVETQAATGAVNAEGRTALDIGLMHLDAAAATVLLSAFGAEYGASGPEFRPDSIGLIKAHGLDLYREICCAMGSDATPGHYIRSALASGSKWPERALAGLFAPLQAIPFSVQHVPACRFLHFGSTRQLIESGLALMDEEGRRPESELLIVNTEVSGEGRITGRGAWVEGCRIRSHLQLGGENVVAGLDLEAPLTLPANACLEILRGRGPGGDDVFFVRCYGIGDTFKEPVSQGCGFCGMPLPDWLAAAGIDASEVWPGIESAAERSLWNARVFPSVRDASQFRAWLWMYAPSSADEAERRAFRNAERYSAAEIALLTDQAAFHARRAEIWSSVTV